MSECEGQAILTSIPLAILQKQSKNKTSSLDLSRSNLQKKKKKKKGSLQTCTAEQLMPDDCNPFIAPHFVS